MKLITPTVAWQTAMTVLREPPHDRERVVYLDGPMPQNNVAVATTVTVPSADAHAGHYEVSAQAMSRAGQHLRRLRLIRVAQIHSHPGGWTGHSPYDDEMAFSQRYGALSIVVPHFAGCAPGLADCSVHIRNERGWREVDDAEKRATVLIVPSLVDLRP